MLAIFLLGILDGVDHLIERWAGYSNPVITRKSVRGQVLTCEKNYLPPRVGFIYPWVFRRGSQFMDAIKDLFMQGL
ncbi:hypothetical protein L602_000100001020 [Cupriavidus gilardii J11]|uniref:Uncharacterized protein n=1 Tax=Cupriavidus gilardii J11 TaxID=936133 RepID=A0A562BVJ1_9BURK|nr:hypothetical protein L602_000100001020 [Cupriavidus gilardii J11]